MQARRLRSQGLRNSFSASRGRRQLGRRERRLRGQVHPFRRAVQAVARHVDRLEAQTRRGRPGLQAEIARCRVQAMHIPDVHRHGSRRAALLGRLALDGHAAENRLVVYVQPFHSFQQTTKNAPRPLSSGRKVVPNSVLLERPQP